MAHQVRQGGKKNRKFGRQAKHPTHVHYKMNDQLHKNKLRRVLKSNGVKAAIAYAELHHLKFTPPVRKEVVTV